MAQFKIMPVMQVKIKKILDEISGVVSQSNVTSWEYERLKEWQTLSFGSPKQNEIVDKIGRKVFGQETWDAYASGETYDWRAK
jgi:hypothetical protein